MYPFVQPLEQNPSQGKRKYTMRCLLITHPTSNPFLTSKEIAQLFQYTCSNDKCFAVVISPQNSGLKILCAKLTDESFGKLKEVEEVFNRGSAGDESFKLLYFLKGHWNIRFQLLSSNSMQVNSETLLFSWLPRLFQCYSSSAGVCFLRRCWLLVIFPSDPGLLFSFSLL